VDVETIRCGAGSRSAQTVPNASEPGRPQPVAYLRDGLVIDGNLLKQLHHAVHDRLPIVGQLNRFDERAQRIRVKLPPMQFALRLFHLGRVNEGA